MKAKNNYGDYNMDFRFSSDIKWWKIVLIILAIIACLIGSFYLWGLFINMVS